MAVVLEEFLREALEGRVVLALGREVNNDDYFSR